MAVSHHNHHTHDHNNPHTQCAEHAIDDSKPNPWSNPFGIAEEPLLTNPVNKQTEDKEHQNKRLELEHFYSIVHSFEYYATWQFLRFQSKHYDYKMLHKKYRAITPSIPIKFKKIRKAIIQNQSFLTLITQQSNAFMSGNRGFNMNPDFIHIDPDQTPSNLNMDKVRSTLKQMARDWSVSGAEERSNCYGPILQKLLHLFPNKKQRPNIRVLNPGCGLGRLPWEIAKLGFDCQGNEFSYFMLLASHFVLNKCYREEMFTIYPYCDINTNQWSFEEQLMYCKIPDVSPSQLMKHIADLDRKDLLSMVAGDFTEIYSRPDQHGTWNVIVSCFFIDTAHNVLSYLEIFSRCLVMNGYLINLGPLLYHFEDQNDPSIELTYNEIMELLPIFGFKVIYEQEKDKAIKCGYAQSKDSMIEMSYDCALWIAQKVKECDIDKYNDSDNNKQDVDNDDDVELHGHNAVGGNNIMEQDEQTRQQKEAHNQRFLTHNIQTSPNNDLQ